MHDILEGTLLPLTTKLLLNHLIVDEQLFTLSTLNDQMAAFKYGPSTSTVTNKPSPISDTKLTSNDTKLKQSGTSTYTVCMYTHAL